MGLYGERERGEKYLKQALMMKIEIMYLNRLKEKEEVEVEQNEK